MVERRNHHHQFGLYRRNQHYHHRTIYRPGCGHDLRANIRHWVRPANRDDSCHRNHRIDDPFLGNVCHIEYRPAMGLDQSHRKHPTRRQHALGGSWVNSRKLGHRCADNCAYCHGCELYDSRLEGQHLLLGPRCVHRFEREYLAGYDAGYDRADSGTFLSSTYAYARSVYCH